MNLPPYELIESETQWQKCLSNLQKESRLAIDLEANSMHAYREQICLIQISIPGHDYLIDPTSLNDLSSLGDLITSPDVEKVFHAAEYDLMLMKREYKWEIQNLFDTMWAARILGHKKYGLASILKATYNIQLDKRFQKSNWCKRPLSEAQCRYAQLDTHYLLRLRDHLETKIKNAGRETEMAEIFVQQSVVKLPNISFEPDNFWGINGANRLHPRQQAVLKALAIFRDKEAAARNQPLFKVFNDRTLRELAENEPNHPSKMQQIYGMTNGQIRRYGHKLVALIKDAQQDPYPNPPKRPKRPPEAVMYRYEQLHQWRKTRAQKRGVDSDIIVSREALWALAYANPLTMAELSEVNELGAWQQATYGPEIIQLVQRLAHKKKKTYAKNRKS